MLMHSESLKPSQPIVTDPFWLVETQRNFSHLMYLGFTLADIGTVLGKWLDHFAYTFVLHYLPDAMTRGKKVRITTFCKKENTVISSGFFCISYRL